MMVAVYEVVSVANAEFDHKAPHNVFLSQCEPRTRPEPQARLYVVKLKLVDLQGPDPMHGLASTTLTCTTTKKHQIDDVITIRVRCETAC